VIHQGKRLPNVVIGPTHQHPLIDLQELWRFRHLFVILVWRTLKVRYQQTAIGVAWAVLQPLMMAIVFTLIFGVLMRVPSDGVPYPVFVLSGLLVWQFVAQSFQQASTSVVSNAQLVTRIYFPRILLPLSVMGAACFDMLCVLGLVALVMFWYGVTPNVGGVVAFVPAVALAAITVLGLALWLGALYVPFRDVGHLLPFLVQLWMFISAVFYPVSLLPPRYEVLYAINPIIVAVQTSRWAFAAGEPPRLMMVAIASLVAAVLLISGLWFFRRREGTFSDTL